MLRRISRPGKANDLALRIDACRNAEAAVERAQVRQGALFPEKRVVVPVRRPARPNNLVRRVDARCIATGTPEGAQIGHLPFHPEKGVALRTRCCLAGAYHMARGIDRRGVAPGSTQSAQFP